MAAFYDDLEFPRTIALEQFRGRRGRLTTVTQDQSGFTQRRSRWAQTKREWDAGLVVRPASQWRLIDDFFEIVQGRAIGFLLRDATDYTTDVASGALVIVTGTTYSFQKKRVVGTHTTYRAIGKPEVGTITIYRTRSGSTTALTAGQWSATGLTDQVTITAGAVMAGDVFTWAGSFFVPARFNTDDLEWETVGKQPGPGGELLIRSATIPIVEDWQDGLLYVPPT